MLTLLSFLFVFSVFSCELKNPGQIVSLSGSMTVALKELNLLKKIHGVSIFNPVSEKEFAGKRYPGGIFLSSKALDDLSGKIIFFDESRELAKNFTSRKDITAVEIKTRSLVPHELSENITKILFPFSSGCESSFKAFIEKTKVLEEKLLSSIQKPPQIIFYLGEISSKKRPEFVIANDGVVKLLKDRKKIETYQSDVPYVNWSSKMMIGKEHFLKIGILDSAARGQIELQKLSDYEMNVIYPGIHVPGISQLQGFLYFFKGNFFASP